MDIRHLTGRTMPGTAVVPERSDRPDSAGGKGPSFQEVLDKAKQLEFSNHALQRLEDRSIEIDQQAVQRLNDAVARAEEKGSRDSLILDGDKAFLVNIPNRTVVTAVDMMELRERVFTNIDSTVLTNNE